MPRTTHPRLRHRHGRAHVRFHRDRKVKARARAYLRREAGWRRLSDEPRLDERARGSWGRHEDEQWLMGCHRAGCGVCHPDDPGWRARERRAWRADWLPAAEA